MGVAAVHFSNCRMVTSCVVAGGFTLMVDLRGGSGFKVVNPAVPAELRDGQRRRFVQRFGRYLDGVPDAVRIDERDRASPRISHFDIIANKKRE